MSDSSRFQSIVARLRSRGVTVIEHDPYGKNNGLDWNNGIGPDGHVDHHFVAALTPTEEYIQSLINMLINGYGDTPGPIVNWFADVLGRAHLIASGPSNHSGKGDTAVLARVRSNQAPLGPAVDFANNNDFTGNAYYSGTESQHPGDSTPWPDALLNVMVAIAGATALEFGWSANRIIDHYEHTNRKIDMSYLGGPGSSAGANDFRQRVAAWMANEPAPKPPTPAPFDPIGFLMSLPGAPTTWAAAKKEIVDAITAAMAAPFPTDGSQTLGTATQAVVNNVHAQGSVVNPKTGERTDFGHMNIALGLVAEKVGVQPA